MTDVVSKEKRSEIMGRVRDKNTKPELIVRRVTHSIGYRFRLHAANLPAKPDLVLPRHNAVILVHGCFWHRHVGCANARMPKSRVDFWTKKFAENVRRDERSREKLQNQGWRVLTIWECETEDLTELEHKIRGFLELGTE